MIKVIWDPDKGPISYDVILDCICFMISYTRVNIVVLDLDILVVVELMVFVVFLSKQQSLLLFLLRRF